MCRECRRSTAPHGEWRTYKKHGCRCPECTEANSEAQRLYRAAYRERTGKSPYAGRRGGKERNGSWIGYRRRVAIYERDGWLCWICTEPVDQGAHWNADLAPSLDHVIPASLGGPDDDENLRCAHRVCNARRGVTPA